MKKLLLTVLAVVLIAAGAVSTTEEAAAQTMPLPVKVLLLPKFEIEKMASEESVEAADIFMTAMKNNFDVGRNIIDRILTEQF